MHMQPDLAVEKFTIGYFMREVLGVDIKKLVIGLIVVWLVLWVLAVLWVYNDASSRYRENWKVFLWTLLVVVMNLLGYFIYIIFRPDYTLEEQELIYLNRKGVKYYADRVVKCYRCSTYVALRGNTKYCYRCGAKLVRRCQHCGVDSPYYARFCIQCGRRLVTETKGERLDYEDLIEDNTDRVDRKSKGSEKRNERSGRKHVSASAKSNTSAAGSADRSE